MKEIKQKAYEEYKDQLKGVFNKATTIISLYQLGEDYLEANKRDVLNEDDINEIANDNHNKIKEKMEDIAERLFIPRISADVKDGIDVYLENHLEDEIQEECKRFMF